MPNGLWPAQSDLTATRKSLGLALGGGDPGFWGSRGGSVYQQYAKPLQTRMLATGQIAPDPSAPVSEALGAVSKAMIDHARTKDE